MATMKTIEIPVRMAFDDEDKRRIRGVGNALTKVSAAFAELGEVFSALADGGRILDDAVEAIADDDATIKVRAALEV